MIDIGMVKLDRIIAVDSTAEDNERILKAMEQIKLFAQKQRDSLNKPYRTILS